MWRGQVKHDQIRRAIQTATHTHGGCEVIHEDDQEYDDRSCSELLRPDTQKLFLESEKDMLLDPGTETDVRESIYSSLDLNARLNGNGSAQRPKPPLISIDFDDMEASPGPGPQIQSGLANLAQGNAVTAQNRVARGHSQSELRRASPSRNKPKRIKTCVSPKTGSKTESFLLQEKSVRTSDLEGESLRAAQPNRRSRSEFELFRTNIPEL